MLAPLLQCRAFSCLGAGGNLRAALVVTLIVVSRPGRGLWHPGVLLLTRVSHSLEGSGYEPCGIYLLFVGFFFSPEDVKGLLGGEIPLAPRLLMQATKGGMWRGAAGSAARLKREPLRAHQAPGDNSVPGILSSKATEKEQKQNDLQGRLILLVKGNHKSTPSFPYGGVNTFLFLVSLLVADCSLPWSSSTGRNLARALAAFSSASSSPAERHSTQSGGKMLAEVKPCLF